MEKMCFLSWGFSSSSSHFLFLKILWDTPLGNSDFFFKNTEGYDVYYKGEKPQNFCISSIILISVTKGRKFLIYFLYISHISYIFHQHCAKPHLNRYIFFWTKYIDILLLKKKNIYPKKQKSNQWMRKIKTLGKSFNVK